MVISVTTTDRGIEKARLCSDSAIILLRWVQIWALALMFIHSLRTL